MPKYRVVTGGIHGGSLDYSLATGGLHILGLQRKTSFAV